MRKVTAWLSVHFLLLSASSVFGQSFSADKRVTCPEKTVKTVTVFVHKQSQVNKQRTGRALLEAAKGLQDWFNLQLEILGWYELDLPDLDIPFQQVRAQMDNKTSNQGFRIFMTNKLPKCGSVKRLTGLTRDDIAFDDLYGYAWRDFGTFVVFGAQTNLKMVPESFQTVTSLVIQHEFGHLFGQNHAEFQRGLMMNKNILDNRGRWVYWQVNEICKQLRLSVNTAQATSTDSK